MCSFTFMLTHLLVEYLSDLSRYEFRKAPIWCKGQCFVLLSNEGFLLSTMNRKLVRWRRWWMERGWKRDGKGKERKVGRRRGGRRDGRRVTSLTKVFWDWV
jgi:hypothetical protein